MSRHRCNQRYLFSKCQMPGKATQFQTGNQLARGGARPASGRKLQPDKKHLLRMRKLLGATLVKNLLLLANLAHKPEKFAHLVRVTKGGMHHLDPILAAQIETAKFNLNKFIEGAATTIQLEVAGELEHYHIPGLHPAMISAMRNPKIVSPKIPENKPSASETQLPLPPPAASTNSTNGKQKSSMTPKLLANLQSSGPTESAKPS